MTVALIAFFVFTVAILAHGIWMIVDLGRIEREAQWLADTRDERMEAARQEGRAEAARIIAEIDAKRGR